MSNHKTLGRSQPAHTYCTDCKLSQISFLCSFSETCDVVLHLFHCAARQAPTFVCQSQVSIQCSFCQQRHQGPANIIFIFLHLYCNSSFLDYRQYTFYMSQYSKWRGETIKTHVTSLGEHHGCGQCGVVNGKYRDWSDSLEQFQQINKHVLAIRCQLLFVHPGHLYLHYMQYIGKYSEHYASYSINPQMSPET